MASTTILSVASGSTADAVLYLRGKGLTVGKFMHLSKVSFSCYPCYLGVVISYNILLPFSCNVSMNEWKKKSVSDGVNWGCPKCKKTTTIRDSK